MRFFSAVGALAALLVLSGCGYVHFGRLPESAAAMGDGKSAEAFTNLSLEHKILKQELALARREGDALRNALERGAGSPELAARLNETAAELARVRADYARLKSERAGAATSLVASAQITELEEKLGTAQRTAVDLQSENQRLRADLERARSENLDLNEKLRASVTDNERAQFALAQLNTELVALKQARARAEQSAESVRAQLDAVIARAGAGGTASAATGLQLARAPAADASPTAELRINAERLRAAPAAAPARTHTVQAGDTLESIAVRYFGTPDRWRTVYDANLALLGNAQPLAPGMVLTIPEK